MYKGKVPGDVVGPANDLTKFKRKVGATELDIKSGDTVAEAVAQQYLILTLIFKGKILPGTFHQSRHLRPSPLFGNLGEMTVNAEEVTPLSPPL